MLQLGKTICVLVIFASVLNNNCVTSKTISKANNDNDNDNYITIVNVKDDTSSFDMPIEDLIKSLANKVNSYQNFHEQPYKPPFEWAEKRGLFRSDIRVNLVGAVPLQEFRRSEATAIYDNDMFSTGWILTALLEADIYGSGAPRFEKDRLELALETIDGYHDHNEKDAAHSIIRTFWPQLYNKTNKIWVQQPVNIRNVALNIDKIPFDTIYSILDSLGLQKLEPLIKDVQRLGNTAVAAFCIPPDFDDTYLNLGLGATLSKVKDQYPKAYKDWTANNTDVERLVEITTKYAYRPFEANNTNKNTIDPRTFYWSRHFIQHAKKENKPLSLVPTWIQNIEEQAVRKDEQVSMPFNVNNVDVTVCANSIYGMTAGAIYDVNGFGEQFMKSEEMKEIYLNSTQLISWGIETNFSSRPDLAQVYYPSLFNFLWYASRTLFLIDNEYERYTNFKQTPLSELSEETQGFVQRFESLEDTLMEAKGYLQKAFEETATIDLLKRAKKSDGDLQLTYFTDFLGQDDKGVLGESRPNNDDALFSTAQAVNVLISTWTYQDPNSKRLVWKSYVPFEVKQLVEQSVQWLVKYTYNVNFKPANSFFSGSVKGFTSLPFWYPANANKFLNGTSYNPANVSRSDLDQVVIGVEGSIDEKTYLSELKEKHFNVNTPLVFTGYNQKDNLMPFWSSEPYTYSVTLLALSQYNNIQH